jgi:hypothetical protein
MVNEMAKFLPTVNLWNPAIDVALRNGQLKLQRGQWVQCGTFSDGTGCKSRFLEVTQGGGTIRCVHGGSTKEVNAKFKTIMQNYRAVGQRMKEIEEMRKHRKGAN